MDKVILIRYGEIILKGLNRHVFEEKLATNIRKAIQIYGNIKISISQGRLFVLPENPADYDFNAAAKKITDVFGVVSVSIAHKILSELSVIKECAIRVAKEYMENNPKSHQENETYLFKIETKRADKHFPMTSPMISADVGGTLLDALPQLKVDVNHPDFIVYIEVREQSYVYANIIKGFGGLPMGTNGKGLLMLSGGIDSPVAGFMMAKRGVEIEAVHFDSYPYTSERSKEKVLKLAEILSGYFYRIKVHIVPFTDTLLAIRDNCQEEFLTIVMRRLMIFVSEKIAKKVEAQALITGESMGQVASQTISSLAVTDIATELPIFRPLIGMDKSEVIALAEKIGTFETSILPYQDCCTVFTPKHPKTKPRLHDVVKQELCIPGMERLLEEAFKNVETITIRQDN